MITDYIKMPKSQNAQTAATVWAFLLVIFNCCYRALLKKRACRTREYHWANIAIRGDTRDTKQIVVDNHII